MRQMLILLIALLTSFTQISLAATAMNNGEISGTVVDDAGDGIPFAAVKLEGKNGLKTTRTDFNGIFYLSSVDPGDYTLTIFYQSDSLEKPVSITPDQTLQLDMVFNPVFMIDIADVCATCEDHFVEIDPYDPTELAVDKEVVENLPTKDINEAVVLSPGVNMTAEGISIRGARPSGTGFIVDGVRLMSGLNIPISSVEHMRAYTGGIPAKYGDTVGGLVVIETRSYFTE